MPLAKRYDPREVETRLLREWEEQGVYRFKRGETPVYSIDTPPATVSGYLHLGHVYSYSQPDFIARFRRMKSENIFYPMGFDDNGLPTERLVERETGKTAEEMGREAFIAACLDLTVKFEREYEDLWKRLGLSIDWNHNYRTISDIARKTSQLSFIELFRKGLAYRREAPTIWCPTCRTAISQAEVNDLDRASEFVTIPFQLDGTENIFIATTRPELLPACVAVFVHPEDERYRHLVGRTATVPLFGQEVPILSDAHAQPDKGTGAVMCCTFGDTVDVEWWFTYHLPLREAIDRSGAMTELAGGFANLPSVEARREIVQTLLGEGRIVEQRPIEQSVRVHERCDTPVEYIVTKQWFVRVLDRKDDLIRAGEEIDWHPGLMKSRYDEWVKNLHWDWAISRQRYYGIPFPVWFCVCGETLLADADQLPVDPTTDVPAHQCPCGSTEYTPETDVMDTWLTSASSPQIAGGWLWDPELYQQVFPMSLRPQAHDIIRTWIFDTMVMNLYRPTLGETGYGTVPWSNILISGWGLAAGSAEKISKSRGGGPMSPMEALETFSADASRYWAASTGPGKDSVISEEKIQAGAKLATKLWNVARLSERFLQDYSPPSESPILTTADRWILSRTQNLIKSVTHGYETYEYAGAKNDTESFFWVDLSDNYLEMAKKRLYDPSLGGHEGARYALYSVLLTTLKLFAPIMPFVTEEIYQGLFAAGGNGWDSIHLSPWPIADESLISTQAEAAGEALIAIATAVRRHKSEKEMSLGAALIQVHVATEPDLAGELQDAAEDIASVTRAAQVTISPRPVDELEAIWSGEVRGKLVAVSLTV